MVALKVAYLGKNYHGMQECNDIPTIELMLWKALMKTHLISPQAKDGSKIISKDDKLSWDGCDFAKCGRTDKGVSAFGQVISLKLKTKAPPMSRYDGISFRNSISKLQVMLVPSRVSRVQSISNLSFTFTYREYVIG